MTKRINYPIAIMSFNRPHYLEPVLRSLAKQTMPFDQDRAILFQDGNRSKKGNDITDPHLITRCIELFRKIFPLGKVFNSTNNFGVALNYERAEKYVFEELGAEAAFFFEDDLLLSPHYLTALSALTELALKETRIAYVAAYGDHKAKLEKQQRTPRKLVPMRHKWGFALTRRQWDAQRKLLQPYLDIVSRADYRDRDSDAIREYFETLGFGSIGTSQDSMKDVASCVLGTTKVMTFACFGKYIGETGMHSRSQIYQSERFAETELYPDKISRFTPPTGDQLAEWIEADRASAKRALVETTEITRKNISQGLELLLGHAPRVETVERLRRLRSAESIRQELPHLAEIAEAFPELRTAFEIRALRNAAQQDSIRILIGAALTTVPGWIATNRETLDLLRPQQWAAWLSEASVDAITAEHVWEHLSSSEARVAARTCFRFLKPGGRLRIAVPDGHHPDPAYIDYVRPGSYPGHKNLFTFDTLAALLTELGFHVRPLEYFKANGQFLEEFWSPTNGPIARCRDLDPRNKNGSLEFTSLIVDGIKPAAAKLHYKFSIGPATTVTPGWSELRPTDLLTVPTEILKQEYTPFGEPTDIVSEHWLDKLTEEQRPHALRRMFDFLSPNGRARIAVRDANFPKLEYHLADRQHPGLTLDALTMVLQERGFSVRPLEWFDSHGEFHHIPWASADGFIQRSWKFDRRNTENTLNYTSLIVDATKQA
jgi:predicted SAM-dependent methyltransferase